MKKNKLYLLVILLTAYSLVTLAQEPILGIVKYDTKNGLPHNFIKSTVLDKKGVLWVLTKEGVATLESGEFRLKKISKFDIYFTDIIEDKNGLLWFSIAKRSSLENHLPPFIIFDPLDDKIVNIKSLISYYDPKFKFEKIKKLRDTYAKDIWIHSFDNSLFKRQNDSIILWDNNHVNYFLNFEKVNDNFTFSSEENGLEYLEKPNVIKNISNLKQNFIVRIDTALNYYEYDSTQSVSKFIFNQNKYDQFRVLSSWERSKNSILIGGKKTFAKINLDSKTLISYSKQIQEEIPDLDLTDITIINNSSYWVSTTNGLYYIVERPQYFKNYLVGNNVSCRNIISIGKEKLMVAAMPGIYLVDLAKNEEVLLQEKPISYGLTKKDNQNIKIGLYGPSIGLYNLKNQKISFKQKSQNASIYKYFGDDYPVYASSNGILYDDGTSSYFVHYPFVNGAYKGDIVDLVQDEIDDNEIWVLSTSRTSIIDKSRKTFVQLKALDTYHSKSILPINDSLYWIATQNSGIIAYNRSKGIVDIIKKENGLSNNTVNVMLKDTLERIWISTDQGLNIYNPQTNEFIQLYKNSGFSTNEFNTVSYCKLEDGRFVLGSIDGITVFDPNSFKFPPSINDLSLDELQTISSNNNKTTSSLNSESLSIKIHNETKKSILVLDKALETDLITNYRYLISGVNQDWVYPPSNSVAIPKLPYGDHKLLISKKNEFSSWSAAKIVAINVPIPYYKNIWFYTLFGIVLLTGFSYVLYFSRKRLEKRNAIIEKEIERQTIELKYKNEKLNTNNEFNNMLFTILGHDFRSPLISFNDSAQKLTYLSQKGDDEKVKSFLESLEGQSNRMLKQIDDLLGWAYLQKESPSSLSESIEIIEIIQEVLDFLAHNSIEKSIDFEITNNVVVPIFTDKEALKVIARNLLQNAIKFANKASTISIKVDLVGDWVSIDIVNIGKCITKPLVNSSAENNHYSDIKSREEKGLGLGLFITFALVKRMKGNLQLQPFEERGTRATFTFKT